MFAIAINTFREIIRNKLFGLIIFFSLILIILSFGLESLALGEGKRVILDFGFSFLELSGLAVILVLGGGLIAREIEGRTIYLMLSKPIKREWFIIGKFFGFLGVLSMVMSIEIFILCSIYYFVGVDFNLVFWMSLFGIFSKLVSILAVNLFFSALVSPGLALFLTLAVNIIGHGGYAVLDFALRSGNTFYAYLGRGLLVMFPNLESLNLKNIVGTSASFDLQNFLIAVFFTYIYIFWIIFLASKIWKKKSFDTV